MSAVKPDDTSTSAVKSADVASKSAVKPAGGASTKPKPKPRRRKSRALPKHAIKQRGWSTQEQDAFLLEFLPRHREVQASRNFDTFWKDVDNAFNNKWPADSDDTATRKKQLRSWFNNKSRSGPSKVETDLLQLKGPKKNKLRHDFQAYSKLYYDERIKPHVDTAWQEAEAAFEREETADKPNRLTITQTVTKERFELESNDVIQEAKEYRAQWNQAIDDGKNPEEESSDEDDAEEGEEEKAEKLRIKTIQAYSEAQKATKPTLKLALQQLLRKTGYVGTVVLSAPNPQKGGIIDSIVLFIGADENGEDLGDSYGVREFNDQVVKGVGKFARKVYPLSERRKFALPGTEHVLNAREVRELAVSDLRESTPSSAVPSHLRNSAQSSRAPSRASSTQPRRTNPTRSSKKQLPTLANLTISESPKTPTPVPDNCDERAESPDSMGTRDAGFDDQPRASSPLRSEGVQEEEWEADDSLSPQERMAIAREGSEYERSRAYNIIRNKKLTEDLQASVKDLFTASDSIPSAPSPAPAPAPPLPASPAPAPAPPLPASPAPVQPLPTSTMQPNTPSAQSIKTTARPMPKDHENVNSTPSLTETHPNRANWPEWIAPCVRALEGMIEGRHWHQTISDWLDLEDMLGYPEGQGKKVTLSSKGRPAVVHDWLKRHRDLKNMPDVTGYVTRFGNDWLSWYRSLQPDWRTESESAQPTHSLSQDPPDFVTEPYDWDEVKKGSQNGFFLLLLTLGWWGVGAFDQDATELERWGEAFDDVRWLLDMLISEEEELAEEDEGEGEGKSIPVKRPSPSDANPTPAKRLRSSTNQ